jgi:NAD(P)-dependent dehydrogenase (short-subunit alcohol dehydrogenase family)
MQPLKRLTEQTIVITGASSGIGRATALDAAHRGARVVAAARDAEALATLVDEIQRAGGRALAVPTDVAVEEQVRALAERAAETFDGIDTWVNGAAVSAYGTFEQLPPGEFRRLIDVNFFGQVHGCRAALPYLKQQGRGALICVGSALSDRAVQVQSAYCASKHAVKALSESLRVELEEEGSGVQVTLIKPSSINTPLFDQAATHMGVKPKPIAPVYDPDLVARAILYAAEHRTREIVVGGGGKLLTTLEGFAGPLLDRYMVISGTKGQQSREPKPEGAPDNLYAPMPGQGRVRGGFKGRHISLYTTARLHPRLTATAISVLTAFGVWQTRRTRA